MADWRAATHWIFDSELKRVRKKSPQALPALDEGIELLMKAIKNRPNPTTDPDIKAVFHPRQYPGLPEVEGGSWIEYDLPKLKLARVLALVRSDQNRVVLFAVTATHDHKRMQTIIKQRKGSRTVEIGRFLLVETNAGKRVS